VPPPFLDTNVLLRHLLGDHADFSPRATALVNRIENGEIQVQIAETVIFEVVYTLFRTYKQPKDRIRDGVTALLDMRGITMPGKRTVRRALDLFVDFNMQFGDAYHVALMERQQVTQVYSFDRDFDRVPGLERIEA
jgi:predicted nucleic acid-binding protein